MTIREKLDRIAEMIAHLSQSALLVAFTVQNRANLKQLRNTTVLDQEIPVQQSHTSKGEHKSTAEQKVEDRKVEGFGGEPNGNLLPAPKPLNKAQLKIQQKEQFTMDFLESQGRRVERNPLEHATGAGRQGDVLVDGFKTELKLINEGKVSTLINTVNNSLRTKSGSTGQARAIVLDTRKAKGGITEAQAREALDEISKIQKAKDRLFSVEIIGENFFIRQSIKSLNR